MFAPASAGNGTKISLPASTNKTVHPKSSDRGGLRAPVRWHSGGFNLPFSAGLICRGFLELAENRAITGKQCAVGTIVAIMQLAIASQYR